MLGSGNISGPWLVHFLSGNLSHQIEHHLFPDLPSNRYYEIAPRVREICQRYGLHYVTGSYPKQVASAWAKVIVLALPNKQPDRSRLSVVAEAASDAWAPARPSVRRAARFAKRLSVCHSVCRVVGWAASPPRQITRQTLNTMSL